MHRLGKIEPEKLSPGNKGISPAPAHIYKEVEMKRLLTCILSASLLLIVTGLFLAAHIGAAPTYPAFSGPPAQPVDTTTATPTSTPCSPGSVVSSPNIGTEANNFNGVGAVSANDVWAVGNYYSSGLHTLTEHWDSSAWSVVPSPNVGTRANQLNGVAGLSANDVWAVGQYDNGDMYGSKYQTLIEHWDGSAWSVVPSPNFGTRDNYLQSVAPVSANDVWAVGYYFNGTSAERTLILHWDGAIWSVVSSPNVGTHHNELYGVAALGLTPIQMTRDSIRNVSSRMLPG